MHEVNVFHENGRDVASYMLNRPFGQGKGKADRAAPGFRWHRVLTPAKKISAKTDTWRSEDNPWGSMHR
jgi:hypothetical protein